jgi:hypothetical protein
MKAKLLVSFSLIVLISGCGHAPRAQDPIGVIRAQIEAVNKGRAEIAASLFSDDAQIVAPIGQAKGKEKIRAFMMNLVKVKEHEEIIDLAVDGTNVTGTVEIKDTLVTKPIRMTLKANVVNGKIAVWEIGTKAK